MKKLFFVLSIVILIIVGYTQDQFLWCKRLFLGEPTTHTIQKGEYLSQIARKYYGDATYWQELALVNRAPDSDAIFPGEEITIPSLEVIKEIRQTRWLSKVNKYVQNQQDILAGRIVHDETKLAVGEQQSAPATEPTVSISEPEIISKMNDLQEKPVQSSSLYLVVGIAIVLFVGTITGFIFYRRKKYTDQFYLDEDFETPTRKTEREPDYQEYLRRQKNKKATI